MQLEHFPEIEHNEKENLIIQIIGAIPISDVFRNNWVNNFLSIQEKGGVFLMGLLKMGSVTRKNSITLNANCIQRKTFELNDCYWSLKF